MQLCRVMAERASDVSPEGHCMRIYVYVGLNFRVSSVLYPQRVRVAISGLRLGYGLLRYYARMFL